MHLGWSVADWTVKDTDDIGDILCLHDCREEPELTSSQRPAGFQAVLKISLHEANITAAAVCSAAGLLVLADQAGNISLIDLQQPAVLCTARLAEQPITALSFGVQSMPPQRSQSVPADKLREPVEASAEDK